MTISLGSFDDKWLQSAACAGLFTFSLSYNSFVNSDIHLSTKHRTMTRRRMRRMAIRHTLLL